MKVTVKESTVVKPMEETPSGSMWLSNLDSVMPIDYYARFVFFFRYNGAPNFFDAATMKAALGKALVSFYPYAGRLRKDDNGRVEINCNAEGALFLEAECDGALDDLGDFAPRTDIPLVPKVDSSLPFTAVPVCLLQLTRFKCGGVSLGFKTEHHVADGFAALHYINTWAEIARGLTPTSPPFLDRRLLRARNPPQPQYPHIEYQIPPSLKISLDTSETSFKVFRLGRDQINALKQKVKHDEANKRSYTRYETIAGHVWRSVCIARRLPHDQETRLRFPVELRSKLRPPLPPRFFGNGILYTTAVARCGEIERNPLRFTVEKVHDAVVRMDKDYMISAIDYLDGEKIGERFMRNLGCPNLDFVAWINLQLYEADFGWGKPVFSGLGEEFFEGKSFVYVDPQNEGGVMFAISLLKPHMELFQNIIYDI